MKLKLKIPLLVVLMLFVNAFILWLFNTLYYREKLAETLSEHFGQEIDTAFFKNNMILSDMLVFDFVLLSIFLVLFSVLIYVIVAKPLENLSNKVVRFENGGVFDETERIDEIGQLHNSFSAISKKLASEKQAQNRMIASISHDIRTPLTSVLGYSEKLIKGGLPEEREKQYLQLVYESARDIQNITVEFDNYVLGMLDSQINKQTVSVSYLAKMLEEEYAGSNINIITKNMCDDSCQVELDLPKIRRVFANLIGNAIKYNEGNNELEVIIILEHKNDCFVFSVIDNGIGVDPKILPLIFEPFYTTGKHEGVSGLGLSICRDIVENHGGTIIAKNIGGKGFKIVITL